MKRVVLAASVVAAAVAVFAPATAGATDTTVVGLPPCIANGGQRSVPAGTEIVARIGYAAANHGLVEAALRDLTTTLSVNGGPAIDLTPFYGPIVSAPFGFVSNAFYPTGIVLEAGQTLTLTLFSAISHPLPDLLGFVNGDSGQPIVFPAGTLIAGTCTVTGV